MNRPELLAAAQAMQDLLVARATGGFGQDDEYLRLRRELLGEPTIGDLIPSFVKQCRDPFQFWEFIKYEFRSYAERRQYLWDGFRPLLEYLESDAASPADRPVGEVLQAFNPDTVHALWMKALARRASDPEGAITAARTLLEAVCKHILDEQGIAYDDAADLPKLYRATSESLQLAPSQHSEEAFKRILGGCTSVVEGLGSLRNRLGDSHGQGARPVRAKPRHAQLAVNLAGAMALYLVETWGWRQEGTS